MLERLRANPGPIPFPKVLYTIPTAQNPTGATITPQRRAAVYELCCRWVVWRRLENSSGGRQRVARPMARGDCCLQFGVPG